LKGKYPKSFKFTGWHPACRCHAVSILKTPEELAQENEAILAGREPGKHSVNEVKDMPDNFKKWVTANNDRIEMSNNRGTLPYFLKDNANFAGLKANDKNFMERAEVRRIEANKAEYERLRKNQNYIDVRFNEKTGGLLAVHREHSFDPTIGKFGIPRGDYERIASEVLEKYGRSVVLESEKEQYKIRISEGKLDGHNFDIKGIEGVGKRNIIDKISEAGRQGAETVVLYYHDTGMFDYDRLVRGYKGYLNISKTKKVRTVYYIIDKKLHKLTI
jgi:hypothetical protein